ncbi:MAG TPA: aldo/keto reductase [Candidatus Dormibacteraeota bacterium]|nr:aldo/keto reductase [Candidatus Dormibacteraeota bacterium]
MKFVEAGGARMSAVGLGTWQFGSTEWGYGAEYAQGEATKIVHRALDLGITLIDTAEIYAFGRSERIVGEAIKGRRDSVFLATKLFPIGLPVQVASKTRASARRLGVDHIDLYQLHWPSPMFPPGATMPRMRKLVEKGLVSHVGVSNHSLAQWQAAEKSFGGPVLSNQVQFSLLNRGPELDLVPWATENARIVIAYSPLAQGLLSGKYLDAAPRNFRRLRPAFSAASRARLGPLIQALHEIGSRHGATPSQVALAWLIRKPNVVVIPGASSVSQVEQNAAAADVDLSDDEDARLATLARAI